MSGLYEEVCRGIKGEEYISQEKDKLEEGK